MKRRKQKEGGGGGGGNCICFINQKKTITGRNNKVYTDFMNTKLKTPLSMVLSTSDTMTRGARCSSAVRAFAHGAMGCRIDPSWWTHGAISRSSKCSMTGVTKAVVCVILSVGWCI